MIWDMKSDQPAPTPRADVTVTGLGWAPIPDGGQILFSGRF